MSIKQRRFNRLARRATVKINTEQTAVTEAGFTESQIFHAVKILPYEGHPYLSPVEAFQVGAWLMAWAWSTDPEVGKAVARGTES